MRFWASAEVFAPASSAVARSERALEDYLNRVMQQTCLKELDLTLLYVPIIMPHQMRKRYPSRTRLRAEARTSECAPQIDYDVFVQGSFDRQLHEYVNGLREVLPHLVKIGATSELTSEFERIIAEAAAALLAEYP